MDTQKTIDMQEHKKGSKKSTKKIHKLIFVLLAITVIIFIYLYTSGFGNLSVGDLKAKFFKADGSTPSSTITLDSGMYYEKAVYKDNIILCNVDGLKVISKKGEEKWSFPMNLVGKPYIQIASDYILVADQGGKEIHIISNNGEICNAKMDKPIIKAKVNQEGFFGVVTQETGYKAKITIFNKKGQELYRWHSAENHILDMDISKDGKRMAVATLDTSKGAASTGMLFFQLNQERSYAGTVIEDVIMTNIRYYDDYQLIAVGDNQLTGFTSLGEQEWKIKFEDKVLQAVNIDSDKMIALVFYPLKDIHSLKKRSIVEIYNLDGENKGTYTTDHQIRSVAVKDNRILLNKKRNISLINKSGKEIFQSTSNMDIQDVEFFNSKREILLISRNILKVMEY